jgi:putative flavoprotein involved in K+ transport
VVKIPVVGRGGRQRLTDQAFLGLSWQHTRGSALLGFVNDDAAHLADRITAVDQATTPPPATAGRRTST